MEIVDQAINFNNCVLFGQGFVSCLQSHEALDSSLWILAVIIVYSFVWSIIGRNCSKVDQIWSVTPWVYCWHYAYVFFLKNGHWHKRLTWMAILMTIWGVRLTYNFARRGGYGNFFSHEEDYRWPILRARMHPVVFLVFNLVFIATYQNVLLWLIASPAYYVMKDDPSAELSWLGPDGVCTLLFFLLLIFETVADQQHYNFQEYKHSLTQVQRQQSDRKSVREGFLDEGLWSISRHPNYFAEQAIWACFYLFSICSPSRAGFVNPSLVGFVLLVLLFQGSMAFGEAITSSKYPAYKDYQSRVSQCLPLPSGRKEKSE